LFIFTLFSMGWHLGSGGHENTIKTRKNGESNFHLKECAHRALQNRVGPFLLRGVIGWAAYNTSAQALHAAIALVGGKRSFEWRAVSMARSGTFVRERRAGC